MIAHVSIPADDCKVVANALAEMMEGGALRFPPGGPDAWTAWSKDASVQIVVTPRGNYMVRGAEEMAWTTSQRKERASETHFALCVGRSAAQLLTIACRLGWPARVCDRGGFFHVVELWIEDAYLVELLDPTFAAEYRSSMTVERWLVHFGGQRSDSESGASTGKCTG